MGGGSLTNDPHYLIHRAALISEEIQRLVIALECQICFIKMKLNYILSFVLQLPSISIFGKLAGASANCTYPLNGQFESALPFRSSAAPRDSRLPSFSAPHHLHHTYAPLLSSSFISQCFVWPPLTSTVYSSRNGGRRGLQSHQRLCRSPLE